MRRSAFFVAAAVLLSSSAWAQQECVPACRSGYFCKAGECVSLCNPPCPAGTTCQADGECSAPAVVTAPSAAGPGVRVNQGWAGGAGVMGIISAVMIAGLTGLTIGFNGTDSANYIGGVAILFTGITIPIVAVGAGSSRWDPQITGQFAWRITGWIAFGLAMALSVTALGIAIAGAVFPAYGIAALGGMGVIAAVCHTIDAFSSSAQAAEFAEKGRVTTLRHSPLLVLAPDGHGGMMGLAGWRVTY